MVVVDLYVKPKEKHSILKILYYQLSSVHFHSIQIKSGFIRMMPSVR